VILVLVFFVFLEDVDLRLETLAAVVVVVFLASAINNREPPKILSGSFDFFP
jgi:hypothetical protein